MNALKIVVACGGTGGHTFPGLAVAKELSSRGHEVTVWTSGRAIEGSVLHGWTGPVFSTGAKPLRGKYSISILISFFRCFREMRRVRPDALIAMGSYSSFEPVVAAKRLGVPIVLHEANTVPGRAIDWLARFADVIAVSFDITRKWLPGRKVVHTGLPIREGIVGAQRFADFPSDAFTVFVTGGSQGAHRVNEIASKACVIVNGELKRKGMKRPFRVIHQTGEKDEERVRQIYLSEGIDARVRAFEREMGGAFATADIVIARSGASTCFELAAIGKPVFFIPLPSAMRNHQHYNAAAFAESGAAMEGIQESLSARSLANWILAKIDRPEDLAEMSAKMKLLSVPNAAARVADLIEESARKAGK